MSRSHSTISSKRCTRILGFLSLVVSSGCRSCKLPDPPNPSGNCKADQCSLLCNEYQPGKNNNGCNPYNLPAEFAHTTNAGAVNIAWNLFIALNWKAKDQGWKEWNPRGKPDETAGPVQAKEIPVWIQYKDTKREVMANKPSLKWNEPPNTEYQCDPKSEKMIIKLDQKDSLQAIPESQHERDYAWLADQNNDLVWYQVKINEPFFGYIISKELYKPEKQWEEIRDNNGVNPPAGSLELKAAWKKVDSKSEEHYITTQACLPKPGGGTTEIVTLGLVGFHIVYKADNQPNWIWATFEHRDNLEVFSVDGEPPADCIETNAPSGYPKYTLGKYWNNGGCPPYAIEISRKNAVPECNGNDYTLATNSCSPAANFNTLAQGRLEGVLQHYQLIGANWWIPPPPPNDNMDSCAPIPLSTSGLQPYDPNSEDHVLANIVLETYTQDMGCLDCHSDANLSSKTGHPWCTPNNECQGTAGADAPRCASDYSFIFRGAP